MEYRKRYPIAAPSSKDQGASVKYRIFYWALGAGYVVVSAYMAFRLIHG